MNLTIAGNDPPDRRSELSLLIREGLGHPVDERTFEGLAAMQARLQSRQHELVQLLVSKRIGREAYLAQLDELLKTAAEDGERLLGSDDFHKVFGEFRIHNMIDVDIFNASSPRAR
jgi:hypothetical protein